MLKTMGTPRKINANVLNTETDRPKLVDMCSQSMSMSIVDLYSAYTQSL